LRDIGEIGRNSPFVSMLTQRSQFIGQRGYRNRQESFVG